MNALAQTTAVWTALVGTVCAACAIVGRARPGVVQAGLLLSGVAALGVALADTLALASGRPTAELATHVGYLATTPIVLPVTAALTRQDRGRWSSACYATACALLVVVLVRLVVTSRG